MTTRPQLNFRISADLKQRLETAASAHGKTLTGWALSVLKAAAENRPVYAPEDVAALQEASEQFRKAGINLNQLLKYLHQYDAGARTTMNLPELEDWRRALRDLEATHAAVRGRLGIR